MTDLMELSSVSHDFERATPGEIIAWAAERFGDRLTLASSFEDAVLIDLAVSVQPGIEVLFLDTQYHFAETLWFVEEVRRRSSRPRRAATGCRARRGASSPAG